MRLFADQRLDGRAVIDFDQTVHGPYGPHMTPVHRGEQ
jgi:hypothetical protein